MCVWTVHRFRVAARLRCECVWMARPTLQEHLAAHPGGQFTAPELRWPLQHAQSGQISVHGEEHSVEVDHLVCGQSHPALGEKRGSFMQKTSKIFFFFLSLLFCFAGSFQKGRHGLGFFRGFWL